MATDQNEIYTDVAGKKVPAIPISEPKLEKVTNNFVIAIKKSEHAIITAIQNLKREFLITFSGGDKGGVAGGMI
jgi:hypothetical protein